MIEWLKVAGVGVVLIGFILAIPIFVYLLDAWADYILYGPRKTKPR